MSNYVHNQAGDPLFAQMVNTYQNPGVKGILEENEPQNGNLFGVTVTDSFSVILITIARFALQISNGASTGKIIALKNLQLFINAGTALLSSIVFSMYKNTNVGTGGTILTPTNLNFSSSNTSVANVIYKQANVSSAQNLITQTNINNNTHLFYDFQGNIVLPPNSSIVFLITLNAALALSFSGTVIYNATFWENPI